MRILFLGTAASEGWPAVFCQCQNCERARRIGGKNIRTRSSIIINSDLKVDLPPDTYYHKIFHNVDLAKIDFLLITHSHQDHFYPEELNMRVEPFAKLKNGKVLTVYGNEKVHEKLLNVLTKRTLENSVRIRRVEPFDSFRMGPYIVTSLPADHDKNEQCLIYVISDGERTILYGHDSGWFPQETWDKLADFKFDLVIFDCTNGPSPEIRYHMGIEGVLRAKEKMVEMGLASNDTIFIATHFSHNGGLLHEELEEKLKPKNVHVAYDGMRIDIPPQ